jgi:hypothetical protein
MTKFINIRDEDQPPIMLDVEDFAVLLECTEKRQEGLYLSDAKQGRIFSINAQSWGIDAQSIADKIQKAGVDLVKMPFYWSGTNMGRYYVNPAQVDFISITDPSKKDDGSEYVALLASMKRGDTVETSYVPLLVAQAFVSAIKQANPNMVEITPDMAKTTVARNGFALIDPTQVKTIHPNGRNELHLSFNEGSGATFRVVEFDAIKKESDVYLNRLINRLKGDGDLHDVVKAIGGLNTLQPRLAHHEDLYCKRLVEKFADSVFSNVEGLIKMDKAAGVFYARMDDVSLVRLAGENGLLLTFNKNAAEQYAKDMNVYYSNENDALEGIKKVIELKNKM